VTQVKICGLTRPEDVERACALGAAYVGLNFVSASPRCVTLERARELAAAAASGVERVGILLDESPEFAALAAEAGRLDLLQIHRPLREEDLDRMPRPVIAVARVVGAMAQVPAPTMLTRCRALLFDTAVAGRPGGTGERFDWNLLEGMSWPVPLFLAGGLTPENVGEGIRRARPAAVDVASGVESAPGVKDEAKMKRFFEAVREADEASPLSLRERGRGEGDT
jgi:phosphoribosylanthranilate isomerase